MSHRLVDISYGNITSLFSIFFKSFLSVFIRKPQYLGYITFKRFKDKDILQNRKLVN